MSLQKRKRHVAENVATVPAGKSLWNTLLGSDQSRLVIIVIEKIDLRIPALKARKIHPPVRADDRH